MPDGWEVDSLLDANTNDADLDADSDTYSNLIEFQEGTNPQDEKDNPKEPEEEKSFLDDYLWFLVLIICIIIVLLLIIIMIRKRNPNVNEDIKEKKVKENEE
jgi:heme/copper-type cytochrome/quinol oxidase subunit 2